MNRISPNFVHAFILTISRLGLLPVISGLFVTELWPLHDVKIFRFSSTISLELGLFTV